MTRSVWVSMRGERSPNAPDRDGVISVNVGDPSSIRVDESDIAHPPELRVYRFDVGPDEYAVFEIGLPKLDASMTRPSLTAAEKSVLALLLDGMSNARIARARKTSVRTVANQVASIFRKFEVSSRAELCVLCARSQRRG